jgi:uridine phosphorylase
MKLPESELILNEDGSIYHLSLKPSDIATTIITVGDPDRVENISRNFDSIEVRVQKREFKTHTGRYNGKRFTVISTGIGTDNVDIVLNELDALVNIDFNTRSVRKEHTQLSIIRIGTSGAIQPDIPVDSFLISETAIGFDNLLHFYNCGTILNTQFSEAFTMHMGWYNKKSEPYVVQADDVLMKMFASEAFIHGCTATNVGFYGPQGRVLRLPLQDEKMNRKMASFRFNGQSITNLEMETAGIYGLSKLLGHRAISLNAILANRANGAFSEHPQITVDALINHTLEVLSS